MASLALDKKADNVVIINIKKLSSVSDYLFVCSAGSERQVQAISDNIVHGLGLKGIKPLGTEGGREGKWALLDFNDVVAHVFLEQVRIYYNIEGLWAEAPTLAVREKAPARRPAAGSLKGKEAKGS
mgnify:CR=1 FL=1